MRKIVNCKECNGTGRDREKTEKYLQTSDGRVQGGYIMCRACNGNGSDPLEAFRWGCFEDCRWPCCAD